MVSLKGQLRYLTVPVFFEFVLWMTVGAADTIMLGKYSDGAVAAVGLANQLIAFCFLVFQFVSVGASILIAQYFGAKEHNRLAQVFTLAIILELILGGVVSAIMGFSAGGILKLMGLRAELLPHGVPYLKICGSMMFIQALNFILATTLRSTDRPKGPLISSSVINVINVVGNYLLIFGHFGLPEMGAAGAAWASIFARGCGCVILIGLHLYYHSTLRIPNLREFANLVKVGIPAMSEELSYCTSQITITYFVNQISSEALAARTYAVNIIMFTYLFCLAITQGGSVVVGHLVGKNKYDGAYRIGTFTERWSMLITMIGSGLLMICGYPIMRLITDNPEIVRLVCWVLVVDFFLEIGRVRNIFACGILRAAGDVVYPVVVGVIFQWSVAVGLSYLLGIPLGWGLIGMWIGFALDENLRGIILMRRWHKKGWVGKSFV